MKKNNRMILNLHQEPPFQADEDEHLQSFKLFRNYEVIYKYLILIIARSG